MQIMGQQALEDDGSVTEETIELPPSATQQTDAKWVRIRAWIDDAGNVSTDLNLAKGITGHVHRVADGKVYINLVLDLNDGE